MLIVHRSLYVSMSHGFHDGGQVHGLHDNPGDVVMPGTVPSEGHCDGSLEQVAAPRQSYYRVRKSRDFANRDSRLSCGRVHVGFSLSSRASRRRCRGKAQRFP
jgi:hypothetical protein